MASISTAERDDWLKRRNDLKALKEQALLGTSEVAIGGSSTGSVSAEYKNQQDGDAKDYLKIDAGFGAIPYDVYEGADEGDQGFPVTSETEEAVYQAALNRKNTAAETIPAQLAVALMHANRKAHTNWKQRRHRLLAHEQMLAANRLAIQADFEKMLSGQQLNGIPAADET